MRGRQTGLHRIIDQPIDRSIHIDHPPTCGLLNRSVDQLITCFIWLLTSTTSRHGMCMCVQTGTMRLHGLNMLLRLFSRATVPSHCCLPNKHLVRRGPSQRHPRATPECDARQGRQEDACDFTKFAKQCAQNLKDFGGFGSRSVNLP